MRQNFADILKSVGARPNEAYRNLATLFFIEKGTIYSHAFDFTGQKVSLYEWCGYSFRDSPFNCLAISIQEFDRKFGFEQLQSVLCADDESVINSFTILCEYILNFLNNIKFPDELVGKQRYTLRYIDSMLKEFHLVKTRNKDGIYIITSADPVLEAATSVVDTDIAIQLVEYTHHSMKGDIAGKRKILSSLANCLEAKRKELDRISKTLTETFFCGANNINVRHDNKTPGTAKFNTAVAGLSDSEMEDAYDRLFRLGVSLFSFMDSAEDVKVIRKLSNAQKVRIDC